MKGKRRGFTLIELLSVIVILAIIALIATPIVLNIINSARKGASKRSAEGVLRAAKNYYFEKQVDMEPFEDATFTCDNKECKEENNKLDIDGKVGTGKITIDSEGRVSFNVTDNGYCSYKYATKDDIYIVKGTCKENNIDIVHDIVDPTIVYKMENITSNSIIIGYEVGDDNEIDSVLCSYGISNTNLNLSGDASLNACKLNNLTYGTYYYKICVKDIGNNEKCLIGNAKTIKIQEPTILWQGYNKISSDSVEPINSYVYKDIANVNYNNENIIKPNNYLKTSVDTVSNIDVIKSCGTEIEPETCIDIKSTKNLIANTWYKVESPINIEFINKGEIYLYTYDETGNNSYYSSMSRNIDRIGPTIVLGEITSTPNSISIPITEIKDNESSIIKTKKCSAGIGNSYTDFIGTISEDGNSCLINNLQANTEYNCRIYAEDELGNSNQVDGKIKTKVSLSVTLSESSRAYNSLSVKANTKISGSSVSKYEFKIDDGSYVNNGKTATKTFSGLNPETNHTIYVMVTDSEGNVANDSISLITKKKCSGESCSWKTSQSCMSSCSSSYSSCISSISSCKAKAQAILRCAANYDDEICSKYKGYTAKDASAVLKSCNTESGCQSSRDSCEDGCDYRDCSTYYYSC